MDKEERAALETTYRSAWPLMDEISKDLKRLPGEIAQLSISGYLAPGMDKAAQAALFHRLKHQVEILVTVATSYHAVAQHLITGKEAVVVGESEEAGYEQLE